MKRTLALLLMVSNAFSQDIKTEYFSSSTRMNYIVRYDNAVEEAKRLNKPILPFILAFPSYSISDTIPGRGYHVEVGPSKMSKADFLSSPRLNQVISEIDSLLSVSEPLRVHVRSSAYDITECFVPPKGNSSLGNSRGLLADMIYRASQKRLNSTTPTLDE